MTDIESFRTTMQLYENMVSEYQRFAYSEQTDLYVCGNTYRESVDRYNNIIEMGRKLQEEISATVQRNNEWVEWGRSANNQQIIDYYTNLNNQLSELNNRIIYIQPPNIVCNVCVKSNIGSASDYSNLNQIINNIPANSSQAILQEASQTNLLAPSARTQVSQTLRAPVSSPTLSTVSTLANPSSSTVTQLPSTISPSTISPSTIPPTLPTTATQSTTALNRLTSVPSQSNLSTPTPVALPTVERFTNLTYENGGNNTLSCILSILFIILAIYFLYTRVK